MCICRMIDVYINQYLTCYLTVFQFFILLVVSSETMYRCVISVAYLLEPFLYLRFVVRVMNRDINNMSASKGKYIIILKFLNIFKYN